MKKLQLWHLLAIVSITIFSCNTQSNELKRVRNSWSDYIYVEDAHYMFSSLGGINAFDVPVRNNTDYVIDEVIVRIDYIKKSGGVYKTEDVTIYNIPPHSLKTVKAPESPRGTSIDLKVTSAQSRDLNLCYPGNGWEPGDPYRCR
jgi:hypothetical protein